MTRTIVCGGGNVAHSLAAAVARTERVTVLTRQPNAWSSRLNEGHFEVSATKDTAEVAAAKNIFVSVPQFALNEVVNKIEPHLTDGQLVVFTPASALLPEIIERLVKRGVAVACLQRVPYIARIVEYGRTVTLSAPRLEHRAYLSDESRRDEFDAICRRYFDAGVSYLRSPLTFVFNNSNPLLHPARMAVLFKDWRKKEFAVNPLFYAEWTDASSELYIAADNEMFKVLRAADPTGACEADYESVLDHYAVRTVAELTAKIRSIESFKSILAPMKHEGDQWVPDFDSRFFTEDVPYGLERIRALAEALKVATPIMDELSMILKQEMSNGI